MKLLQQLCSKFIFLVFTLVVFNLDAQETYPIEGRWDITMTKDGKEMPSWLEIRLSGNSTLVGRFVFAFGSARPISKIKWNGEKFNFSIPTQWEPGTKDLEFEGNIKDGSLIGTMIYTDGGVYNWVAKKAPILNYEKNLVWGEPRNLFNGINLDGWHTEGKNQWVVESGVLKSPESGANLITDEKFMNFKLHIEFRYPKGGNSGIYLRGRYEVQIADGKGLEPSDIQFSGIYGFLPPNQMVAKDPNVWQAYDITLIGRKVTVIANGITVICDQIIPGITGGAINSNEGEPGPFFIQGDHSPIEYRNIIVTPLLD